MYDKKENNFKKKGLCVSLCAALVCGLGIGGVYYKMNKAPQSDGTKLFSDSSTGTKSADTNDKKEIEKIYKIIENKKSMKKSVTDTPKDVKKLTKISFIIGDDEKNIMNIYMKDDMYYLEQPYNGIFKLSKKEYEDIMMYLSKVYTIGEMSKYNVTNNKIMMEIKKEEMKSENMMNNKIKLIIKNMTKKTYEYEEDFYVEMEKDGKWYEVKWTEEPSFNSILHVIKGEETITTEIDGMFRESLTKGKYRIVKSFTEKNASEDTEIVYSAVEFEVK